MTTTRSLRSLSYDAHHVFAYDARGDVTEITDPAEARAMRLLGASGLVSASDLEATPLAQIA